MTERNPSPGNEVLQRDEYRDAEARLLAALNHPLRARSLAILNDRVASPKTIATELGVPLDTIAYHVRELEALECIELVDAKRRRGATEHFYRGLVHSSQIESIWPRLGFEARRALSIECLKGIDENILDALAAGTFDLHHFRGHLSLGVDEKGWRELMDLLRRAREEAAQIEDLAASRVAAKEAAGAPFPVTVALMGFEPAGATPGTRSRQ